MNIIACPILHCAFVTQDIKLVSTAAILNIHSHIHVVAPTNIHPTLQIQRLKEPKLQLSSTNKNWHVFHRRWKIFYIVSGLQDAFASGQLLECTRAWTNEENLASCRLWIHIRTPGWSSGASRICCCSLYGPRTIMIQYVCYVTRPW